MSWGFECPTHFTSLPSTATIKTAAGAGSMLLYRGREDAAVAGTTHCWHPGIMKDNAGYRHLHHTAIIEKDAAVAGITTRVLHRGVFNVSCLEEQFRF